jgi:uncharacterized protein YqjF (DUF2071 family)
MMLSFLKNHPFSVEAFFDTSLVLTYAVPKEMLAPLLPECLTLDTFQDRWAFIAVAMVKTRNLRPKGFPSFLGNDFILTGYRIFVRYTTSQGKHLRGLYILRSETDKPRMSFFGNIFTHYNYLTTDINFTSNGSVVTVTSAESKLKVIADLDSTKDIPLPTGSPFQEWKEARRFAGPLPFTFTYNASTKEVLIIEGVRQDWTPRPVHVIHHESGFIDQLKLHPIVLANAFVISDIPYHWKKGRIDLWKP